jgi:hypothetical protein
MEIKACIQEIRMLSSALASTNILGDLHKLPHTSEMGFETYRIQIEDNCPRVLLILGQDWCANISLDAGVEGFSPRPGYDLQNVPAEITSE